jgi:hypothetical protein
LSIDVGVVVVYAEGGVRSVKERKSTEGKDELGVPRARARRGRRKMRRAMLIEGGGGVEWW